MKNLLSDLYYKLSNVNLFPAATGSQTERNKAKLKLLLLPIALASIVLLLFSIILYIVAINYVSSGDISLAGIAGDLLRQTKSDYLSFSKEIQLINIRLNLISTIFTLAVLFIILKKLINPVTKFIDEATLRINNGGTEDKDIAKHFITAGDALRELNIALDKMTKSLELYNNRAALLQQIVIVTGKTLTTNKLLSTCLRKICIYSDWKLGHLYVRKEGNNVLDLCSFYYAENYKLNKPYIVSTMTTYFQPGIGLPGKVMQDRRAIWIDNLADEKDTMRVQDARRLKLKSAFAFPIIVDKKVIAVIELFSNKKRKPNKDEIADLKTINVQIVSSILKQKENCNVCEI